MKRNSRLATIGGGILLVGVSLTFGSQDVTAADHLDAPLTMADAAVDLADVYAFHTGGNVVLGVTFGGPITGNNPVYDPDTLYTFHIDEDADGVSEQQIYVRFGQNALDEWGVQFQGVPGAAGDIEGAVDTALMDGSIQAQAGIFEDPFFFDLDGFRATAMALGDDGDPVDLMFASIVDGAAVDFFAGANEMGIVMEFPASELAVPAFSVWVTGSRIEEGGESTGATTGG